MVIKVESFEANDEKELAKKIEDFVTTTIGLEVISLSIATPLEEDTEKEKKAIFGKTVIEGKVYRCSCIALLIYKKH